MNLDPRLRAILDPAYGPCPGFAGACSGVMRWDPASGHVPRGFRGATGSIEEVELVLVYAEPGDPLESESHTGLESAYKFSMSTFENGTTLFHRNVKKIMEFCWPGLTMEQKLRKVWMTESVLCSAPKESGRVPSRICDECGHRYLTKQLELFPKALVVALGSKARDRLERLKVKGFLAVKAVSPPGCNHHGAAESWQEIPKLLHSRGPTSRSSGHR